MSLKLRTRQTDKLSQKIYRRNILQCRQQPIATVAKGIVTAVQAGQTQVNVKIPGQDTRFVYLVVTEVPKDVITYAIDKTNVALKVGEQQQLTVIETTTKPDGTATEKNVTIDTTFKSSHPKVAS